MIEIGSGLICLAALWVLARAIWFVAEAPLIAVPLYVVVGLVLIALGLR